VTESATARHPFLAPAEFPVAPPAETKITSGEMTVTPEMAQEWMARHVKVVAAVRAANGGVGRDNRPIRWGDNGVAGYARDMKAGRWDLNGETIKIAWNGTVPDGQHRLCAVIEARVPIRTIVVTGVDPQAQDTIDIGIARKLSDQLGIGQEPNSAILGAVGRWSLRWLHGVRGGTAGSSGRKKSGSAQAYNPTRTELLEYIARAPHLREAAAFASHARAAFKPIRASVWGMAWLLFNELDPLAAKVFLDRVLDPDEMPKKHPAGAFRVRITNAGWNHERLTEAEQLALLIIAWNFWRDNREVQVVQLPKGGVNPKNFPEPK
jgi:hypothetical protein